MASGPSEQPVRFLVTCPARTGSWMLISFLLSHPDICTHGEVLAPVGSLDFYGRLNPALDNMLRPIRDRDPVGFLRDFVWQAGHRQAVGFKAKYEELLLPQYSSVLDHIQHETDIRILHLWRENLLERFLSQYLAVNVYGVYYLLQGEDPPPQKAVRLSPEECEQDFVRTEHRRAKFRARLVGHRILELTYEELVGSPPPTLARVQEFLDVDQRALEARTVRLRTRSLRETISNYEELAAAFSGTRYGHFFTE
jgi:hypothetical protein